MVEYVITLGPTSQMVFAGHRTRIDISGRNFSIYDRNMNPGHPVGEDATGIPATQTIFHDTTFPSYIDLPVIPDRFAV